MGASISTNTANSIVNQAINVLTTYENICSIAPSNDNVKIVLGATGCKIDGSTFIVNDNRTVSANCIQKNQSNNSISASLKQSLKQAANSTVQQFAFGTVADANNFINSVENLAETINNEYIQTCSIGKNTNAINFVCTGPNSSLSNTVVEINNSTKTTASCISTNTTVNAAVQNVVNKLQQSAIATQSDTFAAILVGLAVFIGMLAIAGISLLNNLLVMWGIVFLIFFLSVSSIIYTYSSKSRGNYPYRKA